MTDRSTTVNTPSSRKRRTFLRRITSAVVLVLAFLLPPLLVGGIGYGRMALAERPETPPALAQPLPDRPAHDPAKRTAVIVAGNTMTESSDLMGPYETLRTSGAFNVYVVAPERVLSPLFPGDLSIVPHYSFDEYDATFGSATDLLLVPYIPYATSSDRAVLGWIREKADAGTTILSICAGAKMVADAGVLAGQRSTTHHGIMPLVQWTHPEVEWVDDRRYVESGQFFSAAGVTSGVDATLYTLARMFGREHADQTARAMGYPHTRFLDDPTWSVNRLSILARVPGFFQWDRTDIGVVLYDGVRELEVSSVIDPYPRAFSASVRTIAPERRVIRTRHGLDLVPRNAFTTAPALDRVLVPGDVHAPAADAAVRAWTAQGDGPAVEPIHASGGYVYDAPFRDMARQDSNSVAQSAASWLEYPTGHLQLDGPAVRLDLLVRPLVLGLLGLGVVLWLRRRRRPGLRATGMFALHFGEMWIAMAAGMMVFHAVTGTGHGDASGTPSPMHDLGMMLSMTVPMVAWMRFRGHGWRHGAEMTLGMLAPVVAILGLVSLGAVEAMPWLRSADGPAMALGMLGAMLLRREHYTGGHGHPAAPEPALTH